MTQSSTGSTGLIRRRRRVVTTMAAVAMLTVTAAATTAAAAPLRHADAAVSPSLATLHPGALLSTKPLQLTSYPGTKAWSITYRSTSATGKPDIVSGAVIAPTRAGAGTPIVAYTPGTWGLGDQCAPSRHLDEPGMGDSEQYYIQKYISLGYAVAMTDYEGLGTPGLHTYNVGPSEGHAVLDVVRAAQHLPGSNLSPAAPVAVVGYSQGGFAAGWTAELAPTYAPEINLKGASVGAAPGDLAAALRYVDGTEWAGLNFAAVAGVNAAYPNLHLERYLNAKGRAMFKEIATECVDQLGTNAQGVKSKWAFHKLSEYTTSNFLNRPDWRAAVHRSLLGTMTPRVPVLLYTAPNDDIVPYGPTARLRDAWRGQGADVTFYAPDAGSQGSHGLTGLNMSGVATGWISARLLGLPPTS